MFGPEYAQALLKRLIGLAAFVAVLWAMQGLNWVTGYQLNYAFGLIPRQVSGLDGIVAMPLLHGSLSHLMSNTPPLLLMGALLAATATRALVAVNAVIVILGGALVWVFGGFAVHIGASGLVFGWFGFLCARGLVDRSPITLGAALVVGAVGHRQPLVAQPIEPRHQRQKVLRIGMLGSANSVSVSATSTSTPSFITPTRSHIWRTTGRSWEMNSIVRFRCSCKSFRMFRICAWIDTSRARRLIADQELGLRRKRARDGNPLPLPARELMRVFQPRLRPEAHPVEQLGHPRASASPDRMP
jgi:hypothetical protein